MYEYLCPCLLVEGQNRTWAPFVALHLAEWRQSFPELEACHLATLSGKEVSCLPSLGSGHLAAMLFTLVLGI